MIEMLVLAAAPITTAAALEVALRRSGFGAFPLFETAVPGVYRMRPNQAGQFRGRYEWHYDASGMRNDAAPDSFEQTTLLIGDSIVDGGLGLDQGNTLAAIAARHTGEPFYTVACPGWALANAFSALRALPGWKAAKRLAFVLNTGDFDKVNIPESELSFPTRHPIWLSLWLLRRQVYRRLALYRFSRRDSTESSTDRRAINLADFAELLEEYAGTVLLVRYPMRGEDARRERYFEDLAALDPRVRLLNGADAEGWSEECYADHIHPNAHGLEVLARHLCRHLD
jgi:hypothetical protein